MKITRIDQVAIAAADLDNVLELYAKLFGFSVSSRHRIEREGVDEAVIDVGGTTLQVISPLSADGPVANFLERPGSRLHHLGFEVEDIDEAIRHAEAAGARMIDREARVGASGERIAFMHPSSAGGVLIELTAAQQDRAACDCDCHSS